MSETKRETLATLPISSRLGGVGEERSRDHFSAKRPSEGSFPALVQKASKLEVIQGPFLKEQMRRRDHGSVQRYWMSEEGAEGNRQGLDLGGKISKLLHQTHERS